MPTSSEVFLKVSGSGPRKIIHCDADCFYAALEIRNDPKLRSRPVAVGGSERRGVIATCNYEARQFGVRSAMPSAHAMRLCPELIIIPPNMTLYRDAAAQIRDIFRQFTDHVEPLSLDEAFLDVTHSEHCRGSATLIATEIRRQVRETVGITVSAGVGPNKFIAKVASDWYKPDGLTVIAPDDVSQFVSKLPVERIFGVGRVTAGNLHRMGVRTCGELQLLDELTLLQRFGRLGSRLHRLCRGVDDRPVVSERRRHSLSVEHTYSDDLADMSACQRELPTLVEELARRLKRLNGSYRPTKAFVKVKFADFTATTVERAGTATDLSDFRRLCSDAYLRRNRPVRLLGVGVRFNEAVSTSGLRQLELF